MGRNTRWNKESARKLEAAFACYCPPSTISQPMLQLVEVDGEVREWLREAAEAEAAAVAIEQEDWELVTCDAAGLPFGMVGELRRKLSPIVLLVLLLFMGVDLMDIRVSAVFPSLRQRAAFFLIRRFRARDLEMDRDWTSGWGSLVVWGAKPHHQCRADVTALHQCNPAGTTGALVPPAAAPARRAPGA